MIPKSEFPVIYVNIVTFNGEKWIRKCLDSLLATEYPSFNITVVDNNSTDATCKIISEEYPDVVLLRKRKNLGYGAAHNAGIRYALKQKAKYIVLLNQDLTVDPRWLSELVKVAETDERYAILTPFQYKYDSDKIDPHFLSRMLLYGKNFKQDYENNCLKNVYEHNASLGTALFIKKEVFLKVGGFDPFYFMYHEEGDFLQRCFFHGFKMALVTSSRIHHWHSALHPESVSLKTKFYAQRNSFICRLKNPETPFWKNIVSCIIHIGKIATANVTSFPGVGKIILVTLIFSVVILFIPYIYFKRFFEKRGPCYL